MGSVSKLQQNKVVCVYKKNYWKGKEMSSPLRSGSRLIVRKTNQKKENTHSCPEGGCCVHRSHAAGGEGLMKAHSGLKGWILRRESVLLSL